MSFLRKYYYCNPNLCTIIRYLVRYDNLSENDINKFLIKVNVAKISDKKDKLNDAFNKLIKIQLKNADGINFIISNIPKVGISKYDNKSISVNKKSIKDTMQCFGDVKKVDIHNNNAYIWFNNNKEDVKKIHNLLNNMQMGENIISTYIA